MESTLCGARLELPLPPPLSSFSLSFSFTSSSPAECLCAGRDGERGSRPVRGSQGTGEGRGACQRRGMRGEGDGLGGHVAAIDHVAFITTPLSLLFSPTFSAPIFTALS